MFSRRKLLIVAGGSLVGYASSARRLAAAPLPIPANNQLSFRILRNDAAIGTHALNFLPDQDKLTVHIAVDILVKFGPIPIFRYQHRATEIWENGQVVGLDSKTYDNGKTFAMVGERVASGLMVKSNDAETYIAPATALPATHWNRRQLDGPMINTQDGRLMRPVVKPEGSISLQTTTGKIVTADRFVLSGDVQMETWYDAQPHWSGLQFAAEDGSQIKYELDL
jgi:hypothetical protein